MRFQGPHLSAHVVQQKILDQVRMTANECVLELRDAETMALYEPNTVVPRNVRLIVRRRPPGYSPQQPILHIHHAVRGPSQPLRYGTM